MGLYEDWAAENLPKWLRVGKWAEKVNAVVYGLLDVVQDAARDAVDLGFLSHTPETAVEHLARARYLVRLPGETLAALRER